MFEMLNFALFGISLVLVLQSIPVIGENRDSPTEDTAVIQKEEYANVFNQMPKLFGHIIQLLEDQPEVLETNNEKVFKREASDPLAVDCHGQEAQTMMEKLKEYVDKMMNMIKG